MNDDAGSDAVAKQFMPSQAQERQQAEALEDAFLATNRAGAGGTKAGLVGIRPRGMSGTHILDEMTPKKAPIKPRFSEMLKDPKYNGPGDGHKEAKIILPRNFCPDCGKTDRAHSGGCVNVSHYDQNMPSLHLKQGQLLISFFCQECLEQHRFKENDPAGNLEIAVGQKFHKQKQIWHAERLVRIRQNTEQYIRANLHNPDVFRDEAV